jgi:hypothetical protein
MTATIQSTAPIAKGKHLGWLQLAFGIVCVAMIADQRYGWTPLGAVAVAWLMNSLAHSLLTLIVLISMIIVANFLRKSSCAVRAKKKLLRLSRIKIDFIAAAPKHAVECIILYTNSEIGRYLWRRPAYATKDLKNQGEIQWQ